MSQKIIFTSNICKDIDSYFNNKDYDRVFILTDENTEKNCLPLITSAQIYKQAKEIRIKASDTNKTLDNTAHVWEALSNGGATRHSCIINLGGGMVTDLGGFAASTFKRGIDFINIPTTLLSQVDASVGGKTGINFNGLKNEIGVFNDASVVFIDTNFLKSLDSENICSGYAEMLKHSLISNRKMWAEHLNFNLFSPNHNTLLKMIEDNIAVKGNIVTEDPKETGIRKALNFGHTIGHAFESFALNKNEPILHGYAVAYGIICELYLSTVLLGFPTDVLRTTTTFIRENYGQIDITCDDYDNILQLMKHDKKNTAGLINFTLLKDIGQIKINQTASNEMIKEALDFYRES